METHIFVVRIRKLHWLRPNVLEGRAGRTACGWNARKAGELVARPHFTRFFERPDDWCRRCWRAYVRYTFAQAFKPLHDYLVRMAETIRRVFARPEMKRTLEQLRLRHVVHTDETGEGQVLDERSEDVG